MLTRTHAAALAAAWVLLLCISAAPARAHSQLVSSSPGAAAVLDAAPAEIRLVFSEPVEPRFTGLRITDGEGREVPVSAGATDAADGHVWVVPLPSPLPEGVYTVAWHAMSAADGHSTAGFFTFGVGTQVLRPGAASGTGPGGLHAGHDILPAVVEVAGRAAGYLGPMLALGLAIFALVVLRPVLTVPVVGRSRAGRYRRGSLEAARTSRTLGGDPWGMLVTAQGGALLVGALGGVVLGLVAAGGPGADVVAYLAGTRSGLLVSARCAVAVAGAVTIYALRRAGRTAPAAAAGGIAGLAGLLLLVEGGHAAALASPAPVGVMAVHLGAVSVWLAGVVALAWLALAGERREVLRATVPRFSALALVSVALIGLTGVVAAWAETRELLPFGTPYGVALAVKMILFAVALGLGAWNFLDGGRGRPTPVHLQRRLLAEAAVAATVLLAAGNLASGSPPVQERAVEIARAPSTAPATLEIGLDLLPGRPGLNRFGVVLPGGIDDGRTVVLLLQRLDENVGESRIELRRAYGAAAIAVLPGALFIADGGLLPPGSQWEASAVVLGADGTEVTRQRFTYTMGPQGLTKGQAAGPIDPVSVIAFALLVMALIAVSFAIGGGGLPRADRAASRAALLVGGTAAGVLALVLMVAGIGT